MKLFQDRFDSSFSGSIWVEDFVEKDRIKVKYSLMQLIETFKILANYLKKILLYSTKAQYFCIVFPTKDSFAFSNKFFTI